MTRWERFYRWLGGCGPREARDVPEQWELLASNVAWALLRCGFIFRQPVQEGDWYVNFRWQWRFWRGPYWKVRPRVYGVASFGLGTEQSLAVAHRATVTVDDLHSPGAF